MVEFRIIAIRMGETIVGPWQKDIPYVLIEMCKIWIARECTFTVEFR